MCCFGKQEGEWRTTVKLGEGKALALVVLEGPGGRLYFSRLGQNGIVKRREVRHYFLVRCSTAL